MKSKIYRSTHPFPQWLIIMISWCLITLFTGGRKPADNTTIGFGQQQVTDSTQDRLQTFLNASYDKIDKQNMLQFARSETNLELTELRKRSKPLADSIKTASEFSIRNICSRLGAATEDQVKKELKGCFDKIDQLTSEKKKLECDIEFKHSQLFSLDSLLMARKKEYTEASNRLAEISRDLSSAGVFKIKEASYRFFIATKGDQEVHIYGSMNGPSSIEAIRKKLLSKNKDPLMITNGGMFSPEFKPQGLLVEDGKRYKDLDTLKPDNKQNLNFYLLPNGVFLIDSGGSYKIIETDTYMHEYGIKKRLPTYATQSGPMLLTEGEINRNFRAGSSNLNIRSGVGLITPEKVVFLISDSPVNFYDFAVLFKEIFRCKNSLYLDGAISQMYINEKMLKKGKLPGNGPLGPMISITKK